LTSAVVPTPHGIGARCVEVSVLSTESLLMRVRQYSIFGRVCSIRCNGEPTTGWSRGRSEPNLIPNSSAVVATLLGSVSGYVVAQRAEGFGPIAKSGLRVLKWLRACLASKQLTEKGPVLGLLYPIGPLCGPRDSSCGESSGLCGASFSARGTRLAEDRTTGGSEFGVSHRRMRP
jgi:hypothetical protein